MQTIDAVPYLSEGVREFDHSGAVRRAVLATGTLCTRATTSEQGKTCFVPVSWADRAGTSAISFQPTEPLIQLRGSKANIMISRDGVMFSRMRAEPWSEEAAQRLARVLLEDRQAQNSFLTLHRNLFAATAEYAAVTGAVLAGGAGKGALASFERAAATLGESMTLKKTECRIEQVTETVWRDIWGWWTTTLTAAEKAAACAEACLQRAWSEVPGCLWDCGERAFEDTATDTWDVIDRVAESILTYVTVCEEKTSSYPTPGGFFDALPFSRLKPGEVIRSGSIFVSGATPLDTSNVDSGAIGRALAGFKPLLDCFLHATWELDRLEHLGLEANGFEDAPFGVRVCLDRTCTDKLIGASWVALFGDLGKVVKALIDAGTSGTAIVAALAMDAGIVALAAALGIEAALVAALLLVMLIVLAYQTAVVSGQIAIGDALGRNRNGVCLHYPLVAIGAVTLFNPIVGAAVALNFPIIVTEHP